MDKFELENKELLKGFLERILFRKFRIPLEERDRASTPRDIELYITADCNAKCSYCYLQNFKDGLYPTEFRDLNQIVKNTGIFLDWYIENEFKGNISLFSGEFFKLGKFGFDILDLIYDKFKGIDKTKSQIPTIRIPSNMTFLTDEELTNKVENYIEKFNDIGIMILISASVDGKYLESDNRPLRSKVDNRDDSYYEKLGLFIQKHVGGLHPMVASHGIEKWRDNYKWITELSEKYINSKPAMMLEVRNDDWTDESIEHYLAYLNDVVEYEFNKRHKGNKKDFAKRVFIKNIVGYDNIAIKYNLEKISCSIQNSLFVRMGDLAIIPCHRLAYDHLNYGKFKVENDKIVDIDPLNISMCTTIYSAHSQNLPECERCSINKWCIKGCIGSQYETWGEPFLPNESVCKLYKAKIEFLFKKYYEMGILQEAMQLNISNKFKEDIILMVRRYGLDVIFSK